MMLPEASDRREALRTDVDLWVDETCEGAVYYQRATNLSVGGVFLDRTLPHPPGTRVALTLRLPDAGHPLRMAGEVVEAPRDLGMGVRFVGSTLAQRVRIANFLLANAAS